MEKVKMFKVTHVSEGKGFYVSHVVAQDKYEARKRPSAGNVLSCNEIDVEINAKQLMAALYEGGFCDSAVGVITDLVCQSFPSIVIK